MPDNNGIPFENIDPRTIIGAAANPTKVIRGDGQWVDVTQTVNTPSTIEKDIKAIRITLARERYFYTGTGSGDTSYQDGLKVALSEASYGDTVQQVTKANIIDLVGFNEQIHLLTGTSFDTGGFDIDARSSGGDGLVISGGDGIIQGRNATIYNQSYNTKGIYNDTNNPFAINYSIYNLNIVTTPDNLSQNGSPFSVIFTNAKVYHTGNIYSSAPQCISIDNSSNNANNIYEHVGDVKGSGNCFIYSLLNNAYVIQRGDIEVGGDGVAGQIKSGSTLEIIGGTIDFSTSSATAGFMLSSDSTIIFENVAVIGQLPVIPYQLQQNFGGRIILRGSTTLQYDTFDSSLHVIDERPPRGMIVRTIIGNSSGGGKFALPTYFNNVPYGYYISSVQYGTSSPSDGINPLSFYLYDGSANMSLFTDSNLLVCTVFAGQGDTWEYRTNITDALGLINGLLHDSKVTVATDLSSNSYLIAASVSAVNNGIQQFSNLISDSFFSGIGENQYGTHPAFGSQNQFNIWILQKLGTTTTPAATPAAKTASINGANELDINSAYIVSFDITDGSSPEDYEYDIT